MSNINNEQKEKLLQLIKEAIKKDKELREQYHIGDKFRFVPDRLTTLLANIEEHLSLLKKEDEDHADYISEDEVLIYVYLFNAQGLVLQSWQKMLNPSVFYEYSVNRPIYGEKAHIETFIRSKANKVQHGYLTIAVKQRDIFKAAQPESLKDTIGNPVLKVREGSLSFNRLISFTHNDHDYTVNEAGELVKKKS